MAKISAIIPVYNSEKYLRQCLDSVLEQTFSDIELICVNDCSSDSSLEILREYSKKDERIKVISFNQKQGASIARNTAIKESSGIYLSFIDSDDCIDKNFFENLYKKALKTNADIVKGADIKLCFPNGKVYIDKQNEKIKQNKLNFWSQYTTAIYKTEFIKSNNIDFPQGLIIGEDPVFATKAAILSNKIEFEESAQYYYMRRQDSLNSVFWDEEKIKSYIKYIDIITDFALLKGLNKNNQRDFFQRILDDIYKTRESKSKYNRKSYELFSELLIRFRQKTFSYPIKLLFDATVFTHAGSDLSARRGIFMTVYNILKQFKNDTRFDVTLFLKYNFDFSFFKDDPLLKDFNIIIESYAVKGTFKKEKLVYNPKFNKSNYDVYFSPAPYETIEYPLSFYMFYDVIPMLRWDWFTIEMRKSFWNLYTDSINIETYGFCISKDCKQGFLRFFDKLDEDKLTVSYIASSNNFYSERDKDKINKILDKYNVSKASRGNYIFYLGSVSDPRKNVFFNIQCFIKFIQKYDIKDLYFYYGGLGDEELRKYLKVSLGKTYYDFEKYLVPLGYIEDEDVNALYGNSMFFSFLSLYEGFGMPPLEAMMAGVPVICANNSALVEVVGDAALLVDEQDENEVIQAFSEFYFNPHKREEYIKRGLNRAKMFSWEKTHKIITNKMIEVLSGKENINAKSKISDDNRNNRTRRGISCKISS